MNDGDQSIMMSSNNAHHHHYDDHSHSTQQQQQKHSHYQSKSSYPNPKDYFSKHYDVQTGKFYYINKVTKECTWDKPKGGDNIPLDTSSFSRTKTTAITKAVGFSSSSSSCTQEHEPYDIMSIERKKELKSKQRQFITQRKIIEYLLDQSRKQYKLEREEKQKERDTWLLECQKATVADDCDGIDTEKGAEGEGGCRGRGRGRIQMNWKSFGYISNEVYDFEKNNPTIQLTDLSLNGNDLHSIHDISTYCLNLKRLSLACNKIVHLDESIGRLEKLTHLNLLKNGLKSLPSTIGCLKHLQVLDISHNKLNCLPLSIQYLDEIKVLNLECNELEEIPEIIGNMCCETINVNSNQITCLPRSIGQMKRLKRLCCIDNKLKLLPVELFDSKTIQELHLSKNYIADLPNAIGNLADTLECLWLDNNKLSALPSNFHLLTRLRELQLDRNSEMINPSLSVIVKGPKEVLKWCELNLARCEYTRKRNIVVAVQDLLEQVNQFRVGGKDAVDEPFESVFEANVIYRGEEHYQFLMPMFWESFVPQMEKMWSSEETLNQFKGRMSSFPYERWEVEQTLFQFQDAAGRLIHYRKNSKFRKCSCIYNNGKKLPCSYSKDGWNCERPALLLRNHIMLENIMVERRRKLNEEKRIDDAVETAKKVATQYLNSEEGRDQVRFVAEQRINKYRELSKKVVKEITIKEELLHNNETGVMKPKNKNTSVINMLMECLPWNKRIEREVRDVMAKVRTEFISKEIDSKRAEAIETNQKLRSVLDAWVGLTIEDFFKGWKKIVTEIKQQRMHDEIKRQEERERCELEYKEKVKMANDELKLWEKKYDDFNDREFWQHLLTKEIKLNAPSVKTIIETASWSFPSTVQRQSSESLDHIRDRVSNSLEKERLNAAISVLRKRKEHLLENVK